MGGRFGVRQANGQRTRYTGAERAGLRQTQTVHALSKPLLGRY